MKYLFSLFLILIIFGCGNDPLPTDKPMCNSSGDTIVEQELVTENQNISIIYHRRFNNWVETHKNVAIMSICPLDYAGHGITNGFIICWKPISVEALTHTMVINGKTYNVTDDVLQKINKELNK